MNAIALQQVADQIPDLDNQLTRAMSSTGLSVKCAPLKQGGRTLTISGQSPDACDIRKLIAMAEQSLLPSNPEEILLALKAMLARVARTATMQNEDSIVSWLHGMTKLAMAYPADVVFPIFDDWPNRSKFPPLEAEILPLLESGVEFRRAALAQLRGLVDVSGAAGRSPLPVGATKRLAEHAARIRDDSYVAGWLSAATCEFTETEVFTTRGGAMRLLGDLGGAVERLGVTITHCPLMDKKLAAAVAAKKSVGM